MPFRYWYDTEFLEDGSTIGLISIGIVAEDGRELYLINSNAPWSRIEKHPWLMANVLPSLAPAVEVDAGGSIHVDYDHPLVVGHEEIGKRVHSFLLADQQGSDRSARELWASHGAYDHVALAQLWGRMIDLPEGIPMFTNDLMTLRTARRDVPEPENTGEHDALADARWNHAYWVALQGRRDLAAISAEGGEIPHDCDFRQILVDLARFIGVDPNEDGLYDMNTAWAYIVGAATRTPVRGDFVEQWLLRSRDGIGANPYEAGDKELPLEHIGAWLACDALLDFYRLHADVGAPLYAEVSDGPEEGQ